MNSIAGSILEHYHKAGASPNMALDSCTSSVGVRRLDLSENRAFWLFATIMTKYELRKLYLNSFEFLQQIISKFELILEEACPEVKSHIADSEVKNFLG
jgi:hypothetical protein